MRLARLGTEKVAELRHPISEWLRDRATWLLTNLPDVFQAVWDLLVAALAAYPPKDRSRRADAGWVDDGLNQPAGRMVDALFMDPSKVDFNSDKGLPIEWKTRLDQVRTRAIVMQQKTGRPVQFELLPDARASLLAWLERRGGTVDDYVFPSRVDHNGHLSTRQYARLVDEWVTGVGLMRSEYGTHSLQRTKASIIYRATGNLRAVQILLGHSKIENTVRYLGIDVEDALALAQNTEI